jgi:hypothetical protein
MENPFLVLPIDGSESQGDILRKVTMAMRARQYDVKRIADAQRILFDPLTRATAEFRYRLDVEALLAEQPSPELPMTASPPLPLLDDPFLEG